MRKVAGFFDHVIIYSLMKCEKAVKFMDQINGSFNEMLTSKNRTVIFSSELHDTTFQRPHDIEEALS